MTQSLYGPTARSPEPSPPEFDDPMLVDPQDLDADGRRAWIAVAGEAIKDELLLRLMGEVDALRRDARRYRQLRRFSTMQRDQAWRSGDYLDTYVDKELAIAAGDNP